jgi:hypothetical protein
MKRVRERKHDPKVFMVYFKNRIRILYFTHNLDFPKNVIRKISDFLK